MNCKATGEIDAMTKFPHAHRAHIDKEDFYIMGATNITQSLCNNCNNIHLTLYNDNNEPFASATISPDQVDDFIQKMKLLRNDILRDQQAERCE